MSIFSNDPNLPNYARPERVAVDKDLQLVHDLTGDETESVTRRMHRKSTQYIRQWTHESTAIYDIRRTAEPVFEGLGHTLSAAVGMMHAKPPAIQWNAGEGQIDSHADNIDCAGTKLTVFAKRFSDMATRTGISALVVDYTTRPRDAEGRPRRTRLDEEQQLNLRPKWAMYDRPDILNWRTIDVNNVTTLSLVSFYETALVDDGEFGSRLVNRYRILRLMIGVDGNLIATWKLHEQLKPNENTKPEHFHVVGAGVFRNEQGVAATRLPIAIAYTGRTKNTRPLTATVPLMGVAWANLAHWQIATNLRFNRDLCGFEQLVVTGEIVPQKLPDGAEVPNSRAIKVGPATAIHLNEGGSAAWIGPSGNGLGQLAEGKKEKLTEMAQLGISYLQHETRAAETAEAKRLDSVAQNATLATAAQGIEDALNLALELHAWYCGIEKSGAPVLTLNRDYESTGMPPEMLRAWVMAIAEAGLPVRLLLNAMQQGGLIGADENLEELEDDIMSQQAAIAAQKQLDAERMQPTKRSTDPQQPLPEAA